MGKIEKINYSYQEDEVKFWNYDIYVLFWRDIYWH